MRLVSQTILSASRVPPVPTRPSTKSCARNILCLAPSPAIHTVRVASGDAHAARACGIDALRPSKLDGPLSPPNLVPESLHDAFVTRSTIRVPVVQLRQRALNIHLVGLITPARAHRPANRDRRLAPGWI